MGKHFRKAYDEKFIHSWRLINKWVNDGVPFPGEAYRQWIKDFYQHNLLTTGELVIRGRKVDLSKITADILVIAAERDHIALPSQCKAILSHVSSKDNHHVLLSTGHVSLVTGGAASKKTYPALGNWFIC